MRIVPPHSRPPVGTRRVRGNDVHLFGMDAAHRDERTIGAFGEEWEKFNQFDPTEIEHVGNEYFDIVPEALLGTDVVAMDLGCGSGRWTRYLAGRVGHVDAVDPSEAVFHAAATHADLANVRWNQAGVGDIPFADGTFDLIICLGVLHHVPDTAGALARLTPKLKPGGHLLLYLYYALDGRGGVYRALFAVSGVFRKVISALPGGLKRIVCDAIAFTVYVPARSLARMARAAGVRGWQRLPLSYYHDKSLLVLRNDALDRFGTPLEQRFTKAEIQRMMQDAGLVDMVFSSSAPFWHALGRRG
jgi:SAM-dependent methyltransferase